MKRFNRFVGTASMAVGLVSGVMAFAQGEMAPPVAAQGAPMVAAQPGIVMPQVQNLKIVTIGEFKNKTGASSQQFETLLDRITNSIVNTRKFELVDQARLKEVINQHKYADGGLSDPADAPKKGRIKSAGFIIYGTVLSLGTTDVAVNGDGYSSKKVTAEVELNIRFTEVETGHAMASKTIKSSVSKANLAGEGMAVTSNINSTVIQDAIEDTAKKVTEALMELAFPTKIVSVGQYDFVVNLTQERAKVGQAVKIFVPGEALVDPDTGESLGDNEQFIGEAQITQVFPKFSKAAPAAGLSIQALRPGMTVRPVTDEEMAQRLEAAKAQSLKQFKSRF